MRLTIDPPPSAQCDSCGGVLTFKRVDATNAFGGVRQIVFACTKCGKEHVFSSPRDIYAHRHPESAFHL